MKLKNRILTMALALAKVGYSIKGGHPHCQLDKAQYPEVEAFIDRFLLGKKVSTSGIRKADMFDGKVEIGKWVR